MEIKVPETLPSEIVRRFQASPPVDVEALAEAMGVKVWQSKDLPPHISGKIFSDPIHGGSSGYSIVVNANEPRLRKRFTIAHELAHFILHRSKIGNGITENTLYRSDKLGNREELQANRLAADILMPWHLLNRYTRPAAELARIFDVSVDAMRVRMGLNYMAADLARRERESVGE